MEGCFEPEADIIPTIWYVRYAFRKHTKADLMKDAMFEKADRSIEKQVLTGLALGFVADPFMRWLYPEPDAFLKHMPRVMNFFGGGRSRSSRRVSE